MLFSVMPAISSVNGETEGDRDHRPQRRSCRYSQRVGFGESIAQERLKQGAGKGKGAACQQCQRNARNTERHQDLMVGLHARESTAIVNWH
jgi:hypothetical protein